MASAKIRRSENYVRAGITRAGTEPASERDGLLLTELRERYVDIPDIDVDHVMARLQRRVARDIACGFTVADNVEQIRPDLISLHERMQVKSRTKSKAHSAAIAGANLVNSECHESLPRSARSRLAAVSGDDSRLRDHAEAGDRPSPDSCREQDRRTRGGRTGRTFCGHDRVRSPR